MKKFLMVLLTAVLVVSFAACGGNGTSGSGNTEAPDTSDSASIESALVLLNTVWNSYSEDEKFYACGGDLSEEHITENAPGIYSIDDAETVDRMLGIPASSVALLDDAASLSHMLNANTFTCAAVHVKNAADVTALIQAARENIMQRHWMCGAPEKLVIITVGDYVVSFFGHEVFVDTFQTKLLSAYASAKTVCEESLMK